MAVPSDQLAPRSSGGCRREGDPDQKFDPTTSVKCEGPVPQV